MQGIILSGDVAPDAVEILRRLWVVGVIPLCIGIALVFNGLVVGRRLVRVFEPAIEAAKRIISRSKIASKGQNGFGDDEKSGGLSRAGRRTIKRSQSRDQVSTISQLSDGALRRAISNTRPW